VGIGILIVVAVAVLIGLFFWMTYNRLVGQRLAVDNSWAQIETALQRRHDLIPNLVETVKGYATHERETFENVTQARAAAQAASTPAQQAAQEGVLSQALGRLMAVAEAYPQLRATENFTQLQGQLSETEDQIAITRRVYNDTVQTYNTSIQVFPAVVVANMFGFDARTFFDAPTEAEAAPQVSFAGADAPAPAPPPPPSPGTGEAPPQQ
jgi:LemA protein